VILATEELRVALGELRDAHQFKQRCKADSEKAYDTGAMCDANEWIDTAVTKVVSLLPPEV
jgi:hypothetical protein